jgi:hypothetical protein
MEQLEKSERDPLPAWRKQIIRKLERSVAAYEQGKRRGPIHQRMGEYCRVELKAGRRPANIIPIAGRAFNVVPAEHFVEFVTGFQQHVQDGGFDNEIRTVIVEAASQAKARPQPRKRRPLSPQALKARNEKRAATLAAKKGN